MDRDSTEGVPFEPGLLVRHCEMRHFEVRENTEGRYGAVGYEGVVVNVNRQAH
ncbi:MAG: hypothetical protein ACYDDN_08855 [Candidatus Desulforudaceae bacterium]|nr:hypothetical protein [Bacillota bacterium]MBV1734393.1 hypothetical protein [Desulforudis sp.]MDP3050502.1 hypothetical protein [Eubacteriales bacterium]MDQ7789546.1 hypothetical protein [Clostridia bacterium]MBU4532855.1 hypothetical protein [Bacillota bacterium]